MKIKKELLKVFLAGLWLCMGATCSPLTVCYDDMACAANERCFKGDNESSAAEGICLAPSCEPICKALEETCVWDTIHWEAHCVAIESAE